MELTRCVDVMLSIPGLPHMASSDVNAQAATKLVQQGGRMRWQLSHNGQPAGRHMPRHLPQTPCTNGQIREG